MIETDEVDIPWRNLSDCKYAVLHELALAGLHISSYLLDNVEHCEANLVFCFDENRVRNGVILIVRVHFVGIFNNIDAHRCDGGK